MHAQWLTICDPMDGSPPDSSGHGISQARILVCVVISFSRAGHLPDPGIEPISPASADRFFFFFFFFYHLAACEALFLLLGPLQRSLARCSENKEDMSSLGAR